MGYQKDFKSWLSLKERINKNPRPSFEKLDVWWCYFGCNVGTEKDGKGDNNLFLRPVILFEVINEKHLIAIPLTKTIIIDDLRIPFYFDYDFSVADISHIRALDSRRLFKKMGRISFHVYGKIKKAIASRFLQ